jgi:hypothetical protein
MPTEPPTDGVISTGSSIELDGGSRAFFVVGIGASAGGCVFRSIVITRIGAS